MTDTVFARGAGGALFQMDVPKAGHALERWEEALRKGDLTIVPAAEWVARADGSRYLVVPVPEAAATAPKAKPTGKAAPAADTEAG